MSDKRIEILERSLAREKKARKEAEKILENKALELYNLSQQLKESNNTLESLLAKKDLELKGVFKNIADAYCVMDMYGNVLEMNDATFELLDYNSREENINLTEFVHAMDVSKVFEAFEKLKKQGEFKDLKIRIVSKSNITKHIHINASIILNTSGKPIAVQGIARDITNEFMIQRNLIESESRLKTLILNLDSGILLEDEDCNIIFTNTKFCELFNISDAPEELKGLHCSVRMEQFKTLFEKPDQFMSRMQSIVHDRREVIAEELKMTDGTILERDYIPIFEKENYKGHLWTYRDVTLQRNYSKNLEAEKQKYSNIIANMHLGLIETNSNNKIVFVNQSFIDITEYSEDELLGKSAIELLIAEREQDLVKGIASQTRSGESNSHEIQIKTKSGKLKSVMISSAPNYNSHGVITGTIGVILDITDTKNLQEQKEALLKNLEISNNDLQEYAHIVSHDLKSPLRSIFALVAWIKEDNQEHLSPNSLDNIGLIESTLEKMEQLISDILNYSSVTAEAIEDKPVDLNGIIKDLQQILFVPKHIQIKVLNPLPVIHGDQTRLQQLFQNLLSNAIRYIDKEVGHVIIDVIEKPSHYQFSIEDNGIGIEEEYHDKIFKIFHSLSDTKESSGIGLSIVKKIVDLYKGDIWLESSLGKGTTFYFTLKKRDDGNT